MILSPFFKKSNLNKSLVILFLLLIVLSISILITSEIIELQPNSVSQAINDRFNKIKVQLEFNGLTKTVNEMTEDYSKLFDGNSNIIITDDSGKILYNVNNGYISEKNKFLVLVDPWQANSYGSRIAYLIDSKNTIKYSTQLDIYFNTNKLKEQISKSTLAEVLFSKTPDIDTYSGDTEIINSDGSSYVNSSETKIIMNYEYIASKGLNLYSLYDSDYQYNNYYLFINSVRTAKHWLIILTIICSILFWIFLPLWVFKDAEKRHLKSSKWTILTVLLNVFGLCIYLIFRSKSAKCLSCNKALDDDWILCPYCGEIINGNK